MCEPCDDWRNNCALSPELEGKDAKLCMEQKGDNDSSLFEDDEEVTESKIRAFLDEKVVH